MRAWLCMVLVALPFSGCLDGFEPQLQGTVFAFSPIVRGDPEPRPMKSCDDLLDELNQRALTQARVMLDQSISNMVRYGHGGDVAVEDASDSDRSASAPGAAGGAARASTEGAQVTGTNNQEAAADEADIVKTDGEWTYVFSGRMLYILQSTHVGTIDEVARKEFPDAFRGELLLERRDLEDDRDDRLVLILPGQAPADRMRNQSEASSGRIQHGMTQIVVLSLNDRSAPRVEREFWIEGHSVGARLVDGTAYAVVHLWEQDLGLNHYPYPDEKDLASRGMTYDDYHRLSSAQRLSFMMELAREIDARNVQRVQQLTLEDHLPVRLRSQGRLVVTEPTDERSCNHVYTSKDSTGRGVTTILALGVRGAGVTSSTTQVTGSQPIVYASGDALVLAAPSQDFWWFWAQPKLEEATDLHWFDLKGLDVEPRGSGRVEGIVQDQFGIDVEGDQLRVATTTGTWGRWWLEDPDPMMNHVAVFHAKAGRLVPQGIVGGIAPGERIWSARFTSDRAYLVTFRQTDPLWVIDLRGAPKILGELEIPGVSTYLHPLDDDALLAIGYGPQPNGQNLDWGSIQVSLFDISDVKNPRRADVLTIKPTNGHAWSGATHEHRAFTYWDAVDLLAIPVTTHKSFQRRTADGDYEHVTQSHIGLRLIDVDREAMTLGVKGEVNQNRLVPDDERGMYGFAVERSYFLGFPETGPVSVYAISMLGITSNDLETLKPQDEVRFELSDYYGHYID